VDIGYLLRYCSQAFIRARLPECEKRLEKVPLLYRAICDIRIMHDRLLGVSDDDYVWTRDWL
jgi:hypothetical protein